MQSCDFFKEIDLTLDKHIYTHTYKSCSEFVGTDSLRVCQTTLAGKNNDAVSKPVFQGFTSWYLSVLTFHPRHAGERLLKAQHK